MRRPVPTARSAVLALCLLASTAYAQESAPTRIETAPAGTSTDVPLRDLLTQRMDADKELSTTNFELRDRLINQALENARIATNKAEEAQAARNAVANEFRAALSDLGSTMARREALDSLADRVAALENRQAAQTGQGSGIQTAWTVLLGAIGTIVVVAGLVVTVIVSFRRKEISR